MHIELHCGSCDSYLHIASPDDDAVWFFVHRFANAHVICGFITQNTEDVPVTYRNKVIKPRLRDESEEA